jgi:hypothetical protein
MVHTSSHEESHPARPAPSWLLTQPMRYPNGYLWFFILASMDIVLTCYILHRGRGIELNPLAQKILEWWDVPGAVALKYSMYFFVVAACEIVGRHKDAIGRRLTVTAVVLSAFPVVWSLTLLCMHGFLLREPAPIIGP